MEVIDGSGVIGLLVGYTFMAACSLSALLAFYYAWKRGILSHEEAPKYQMMQEENEHESL